MRGASVMAVALAALFLSGCLASEPRLSHQEYEREMQAIANDMSGDAAELVAGASPEDFAELMHGAADMAHELADRVGDINPPEEIDRPHHELADGLDEAADLLDRMVESVEDGDFFGAMEIANDMPADLETKITEAIREIRTAGYYIGDSDDWG